MSVDRAAAVRVALRKLVATHGFHGASMSAVAKEAGVATGTAYVHYDSKDDLVCAAYRELKQEFSLAGVEAVDQTDGPATRFRRLWLGCYDYLAADPDRARFMIQVDASPYAGPLHEELLANADDPLLQHVAASDMQEALLPLPVELLYDLAVGPLLRLVASERALDRHELIMMADACWHAISHPGQEPSR